MKREGFTLVELLVVIAIIGILAAVIVPNAFKSVEKARIAEAIEDLHSIKTASLAYYADIGFFPPDVGAGDDPGFMQPDPQGTVYWSASGLDPSEALPKIHERWDGPYLEKWKSRHPWQKYASSFPGGGMYDYENWSNWTPGGGGAPTDLKIGVCMYGVPKEAGDIMEKMYNAGKFPFELYFDKTSGGGNWYHIYVILVKK